MCVSSPPLHPPPISVPPPIKEQQHLEQDHKGTVVSTPRQRMVFCGMVRLLITDLEEKSFFVVI